MKYKVILVIVISFLMLAGGVYECIYITDTLNEFVERIDEILEEDEINPKEVYETKEWLQEKHKRLELVIPHFELNELTIIYSELEGAVREKDYESATSLLMRLRESAIRLQDVFKFRYQNII